MILRRTILRLGSVAAGALAASRGRAADPPRLRFVRQVEKPVLSTRHPDAAGNRYGFSPDGEHWNAGRSLTIQPKPGEWAKDVRTPLGLIHEGGREYTLFSPVWNPSREDVARR